ncbi:MAG: hypothetical protein WBA89_16550 [Microcoleus sp.]|uniref:hypothetical protein n=1 Tax=Microcoleus sp. TaxID=44472 RepID=UPI003C73E6ED
MGSRALARLGAIDQNDINTYCANSQGGMRKGSIDCKFGYTWNVASTSLSRCRLLKVDRAKLNSAS